MVTTPPATAAGRLGNDGAFVDAAGRSLTEPLPVELPVDVDIRTLDAMTDAAVDQLPFGVIGLTAGGRIFRYNLAEARFARLDRQQVLGLDFFQQVAPCTATPEFQGRFQAFVDAPSPHPIRFSYIFDFKFGAQEVEVELVQGTTPTRFYLCVNRARFLPVRTEQPAEVFAPLQSDLAPDEAALGVQRELGSRRMVSASPLFFASLRQTWDKMAPKAWGLFCAEWGQQWGKLAVVDLETEALEEADASMRELTMKDAVERIGAYLVRQGWGRLQVDFAPAKDGAFVISLERNALAEAVGDSETTRCHLLAGFFRAVFTHLAYRIIHVDEICCKAQGHPKCQFVAIGHGRAEQLRAAHKIAGDDVTAVLAGLKSGPTPHA